MPQVNYFRCLEYVKKVKFLLKVSDHEFQKFVLELGPVDGILARPVKKIFYPVNVSLNFSLQKMKDVVSWNFLKSN